MIKTIPYSFWDDAYILAILNTLRVTGLNKIMTIIIANSVIYGHVTLFYKTLKISTFCTKKKSYSWYDQKHYVLNLQITILIIEEVLHSNRIQD